jgi:hypothetical protein
LSINREKSGSLISGQHGVLHAKSQWHTIKKCLRKDNLNGAISLELLELALIKTKPSLRIMLTRKDGQKLSIIGKISLIAANNIMFREYLVLCLLIKMAKLKSTSILKKGKTMVFGSITTIMEKKQLFKIGIMD